MGIPDAYTNTTETDQHRSAIGRWSPESSGDQRRAAERRHDQMVLPAVVAQKAKKPGCGLE
jgi:hypothetical protein